MTATDTGPAARRRDRNPGLDALRASLTLLVVMHRTAITYGAIGGWFYRERPTDGSLSSTALVYLCTVDQAFFMGLFFLLAGYLTPAAIERHGALTYLVERTKRLGLPLLVFGWVLGPATIALAQTSRGRPFVDTLARLWRDGTWEPGPLWFSQALLAFALAACVASWLRRGPRSSGIAAAPAVVEAWPSNAVLFAAALATGLGALVLRTRWPVGTSVWGMQPGYFASYLVLFVFGCLAAPRGLLERLPPAQVRLWWRVALGTLPVLAVAFFAIGDTPGWRRTTFDAIYAFWEPFVAWGTVLKLLDVFQRRTAVRTRGWAILARRAYAIFVIHPWVLVGLALAWRAVRAPALLKFVVTGTISCALCYLIAGWLLRVPALRRIV